MIEPVDNSYDAWLAEHFRHFSSIGRKINIVLKKLNCGVILGLVWRAIFNWLGNNPLNKGWLL
jgi:hypothetical protein